jgi:hypothetical protein
MVAEEVAPFGVWLIPTDDDSRKVNGIIEHLARKYDRIPFPAHTTLWFGDFSTVGSRDKLARLISEICARHDPISAELDDIGYSDDYGTFFFVKLNAAGALGQLQADTATVFDHAKRPVVGLHLSLIYNDPTAQIDRVELAREVRQCLPLRISFDKIQIVTPHRWNWRDVENWKIVYTARLGHRGAFPHHP